MSAVLKINNFLAVSSSNLNCKRKVKELWFCTCGNIITTHSPHNRLYIIPWHLQSFKINVFFDVFQKFSKKLRFSGLIQIYKFGNFHGFFFYLYHLSKINDYKKLQNVSRGKKITPFILKLRKILPVYVTTISGSFWVFGAL